MTIHNVAQVRYFGSTSSLAKTAFEAIPADEVEKYIQDYPYNTYIYESNKYVPLVNASTANPSTYYRPKDGYRYNYPYTVTKEMLSAGTIFNQYSPMIKLGIQGIPGTKFRINANIDWIILGSTGIYEVDLTNNSALITNLSFDTDSLTAIDSNPNGYLIVDMVYEEEV